MKRMKRMKKFVSFLLTAIMVFAMAAPVFAEDPQVSPAPTPTPVETEKGSEEFTITLTDAKSNHEYLAYQVFKGDLLETPVNNSTEKKLSNIEWGTGVKIEDSLKTDLTDLQVKIAKDKTITPFKELEDLSSEIGDAKFAIKVAELLANNENTAEVVKAFANVIAKHLTDSSFVSDNGAAAGNDKFVYTIPKEGNLAPGYYFVKDNEDKTLGETDAYTRYIMQVVSDVTVEVKSEIPTIEKKIVEETPVDANNAGLGEVVHYQIKGNVPDYTEYKEYFYVISDTMSSGLTFNNDIKVTIGGSEIPQLSGESDTRNGFYLYTKDATDKANKVVDDSHTFEIAFKNIMGYDKGAVILVTYSASVNENAIDTDNNGKVPNKVDLKYSNNPNSTQNGTAKPGIPDGNVPTGKTPEDITITYVAKIDLTKRAGTELTADTPILPGAEFTLTGKSTQTILKGGKYYEPVKSNEDGAYWLLKNGTYTNEAPIPASNENRGNEDLYVSTTQKYKEVTATNKITQLVDVKFTAVSDDSGKIIFGGLGEGTYTIEETGVPAGYNKADNITVVIECTEPTADITSVDTNATWKLAAGTTNGVTLNNTAKDDTNEPTAENGNYAVTVLNRPGSVLPETGGIGTTIFYVLGSILALGAGIVLITRRRMNSEQ